MFGPALFSLAARNQVGASNRVGVRAIRHLHGIGGALTQSPRKIQTLVYGKMGKGKLTYIVSAGEASRN